MSETIPIAEGSEALIVRGLPHEVLPARPGREAVAIVHQETVGEIAGEVASRCGDTRVVSIAVPDREAVKDVAEVMGIYRRLFEEGVGRHDTVVGVGGGAVTDAAGFVAATWLRGVESVMLPTTLLAAVDAAIGGKTGVNLEMPLDGADAMRAKNLIGAFWHPRRVVVDLDVLDRLPGHLRTEGTAEIVKAGLIGDPDIITAYTRDGIDAGLDVVVPRAIRVKAAVVGEDFREQGRRAVLNFGHTIGHAIEGLTGIAHGHAVSVGMVAEAAISAARFGFDHRWLADLLFSLGLPVAASGVSRQASRTLILRDKKRTAAGVRMALLRGVGAAEVVTVTDAEIDLGLSAIGAV